MEIQRGQPAQRIAHGVDRLSQGMPRLQPRNGFPHARQQRARFARKGASLASLGRPGRIVPIPIHGRQPRQQKSGTRSLRDGGFQRRAQGRNQPLGFARQQKYQRRARRGRANPFAPIPHSDATLLSRVKAPRFPLSSIPRMPRDAQSPNFAGTAQAPVNRAKYNILFEICSLLRP